MNNYFSFKDTNIVVLPHVKLIFDVHDYFGAERTRSSMPMSIEWILTKKIAKTSMNNSIFEFIFSKQLKVIH